MKYYFALLVGALIGCCLVVYPMHVELQTRQARYDEEHEAFITVGKQYNECESIRAEVFAKLGECTERKPAASAYKDCCIQCMEQIISLTRKYPEETP